MEDLDDLDGLDPFDALELDDDIAQLVAEEYAEPDDLADDLAAAGLLLHPRLDARPRPEEGSTDDR